MIRRILGKIFSSKAFYIVFSLLVSIALWMYVEISENQTVSIPVVGVQVVCLNEDLLNDRNLLISSMTPETVNLEFECPLSLTSKLTRDALSVVIDLANITTSGPQTLRYEIIYPAGLDEKQVSVTRSVNLISLYIDRTSWKNIRVDVPYRGGAAEGFMNDPPDYSPREITIYGPAEFLSSVNSARVSVARESLTTTFNEDLTFTLLDEDDEPVDADILDKLTYSDEKIHVTINVRMMKEVPLNVDRVTGAGATDQNTRVTIDPLTIIIAGDPEEVRGFNSINLGTIDLTRFEYSDTYSFPIIVPDYFDNISGETQARVLVEVLGLGMRYLPVSGSSIHLINEPVGYIVEIRTLSLDIRIRGRQEDLDNITEANISVVASLADLGPGTQRVPARIHIDGIAADVGAIGTYNIVVAILRE